MSGRWRPAACRRNSPCVVVSTNSPSIWATRWLACAPAPRCPARKAAVTASPMAGFTEEQGIAPAVGRDLAAQPGKALAPAPAPPPTSRLRQGVREWCRSPWPRWKSSRVTLQARNRRDRRAGTRGDQQRSNITTRSPPSFKLTIRLWSSLKRASPCRTVMAELPSRCLRTWHDGVLRHGPAAASSRSRKIVGGVVACRRRMGFPGADGRCGRRGS